MLKKNRVKSSLERLPDFHGSVCLPPCSQMSTRHTVPRCGNGSRRSGTRSKADGEESMEYLIGIGPAVVVCAFATLVGFDRDRVFYPTLVTVIATYTFCLPLLGVPRRCWPWSP